MNPYLRAKREKYERLRSAITELQETATRESRDLDEDEMRSINSTSEELRTLAGEIEILAEDEERHLRVNELAALTMPELAEDDPLRPYSLTPSADQLSQMRAALTEGREIRFTLGRTAPMHHRAAVELADVGGAVAGLGTALPRPRRLVEAVGLIPEGVDSGGASGPLFGATSGQAPTDEGDPKPEADEITNLVITPEALARWTDNSRHAFLSSPGYLGQVTAWHAQHIAKDEDLLIVTALAAAAGAPIDGTDEPAQAVRTAIATVTDAVAAEADVVLCHPVDYGLVTEFAPTSGADVGTWAARIGSAVVYPTSAVDPGAVLVAALRAGGRFVVAMPPSVAVLEDLKNNVITIRTEEFAGFGVRLAGSVVAVDLPGS